MANEQSLKQTANRIWQPLYDSHLLETTTVTAAARDYEFFKIPVGGSEGVQSGASGTIVTTIKTKFHTNSNVAGMMEDRTRFFIHAISIGLWKAAGIFTSLPDIEAILWGSRAIFTIKIRDVIYFELPLFKFTSGWGNASAGTTTADTKVVTNIGIADPRAIYTLKPKYIELPQRTPFAVTIRQETPATVTTSGLAVRFFVFLEGIYEQPLYK